MGALTAAVFLGCNGAQSHSREDYRDTARHRREQVSQLFQGILIKREPRNELLAGEEFKVKRRFSKDGRNDSMIFCYSREGKLAIARKR